MKGEFLAFLLCLGQFSGGASERHLYRISQAEDLPGLSAALEARSCEVLRMNSHGAHIYFICEETSLRGLPHVRGKREIILRDIEAWIQEERRELLKHDDSSASPELDFKSFPSFLQLEAYYKHLANEYPGIVSLEVHGKTHENRSIYLLRIGQVNDRIERKALFIDGGIHAREWGSVSSVAFIVSKLVELFKSPEKMQNDVRGQVIWYIMPLVNPDGYEYTRTTSRLWRKNRAPPPKGSRCFGVDLNRNWNVSGYGVGASNDPCSDIYKGAYPDSEPEVKTAKKLLSGLPDIRHYLGFHSFGSYVLTPFGYTKDLPKDHERLMALGHEMREAIREVNGRNYTVGPPAHIFYLAGGASDDFSKLNGIPSSMTIELPEVGGTGFLLPKESIIEIGEEAWAALKPAAQHVLLHEDDEVLDSLYVPKTLDSNTLRQT